MKTTEEYTLFYSINILFKKCTKLNRLCLGTYPFVMNYKWNLGRDKQNIKVISRVKKGNAIKKEAQRALHLLATYAS